ncbi:5-formyltetrahydrofolate cyclo-ligase [bacterium]|nr:5-formyltetrahydrofolate cyclo-ligase [bacterium]MCP5462389.1 5-formyltetrahydrofolate cyclo-ligase [bacterium]
MEEVISKSQLRHTMRSLFYNEYGTEELTKKSARICLNILKQKSYASASTVLFYMPLADEVDITPIILHSAKNNKTILIPKTIPHEKTIRPCVIYNFDRDVKKGYAGILEPIHDIVFNPSQIDLIIVPGRAFDHTCCRLGRGEGYYDRFFLTAPFSYKMGVAFDFQIVPRMEQSAHDVSVDCVVTDTIILMRQ